MLITTEPFGVTAAGEAVTRYTLQNRIGVTASFLNYGCTLQQLLLPVRGRMVNAVLGYDTLSEYEAGSCYFGALVGRYANRISGGQFRLNGRICRLTKNDGENYLHGSFSKKVCDTDVMSDGLVFRGFSPDGEDGFPGNLIYRVSVHLTDFNQIIFTYEAETDAPTVVSLTNHSYFNLDGSGSVLGHRLKLRSDKFTPVDSRLIPTGEVRSVARTAFDFRRGKRLGRDLELPEEQLRLAGGYDHNYVLRSSRLSFAELDAEHSGVRMVCNTTMPGVQLYTGNYVNQDTAPGPKYPPHAGVCLETQRFPNSPNCPTFPSAVLRPGEHYFEQTAYQFLLP